MIGENIKRTRKRRKLTQLSLAHAIGYKGEDAGAVICRFERGDQEPRIGTLRRIAQALEVPINTLMRIDKIKA